MVRCGGGESREVGFVFAKGLRTLLSLLALQLVEHALGDLIDPIDS